MHTDFLSCQDTAALRRQWHGIKYRSSLVADKHLPMRSYWKNEVRMYEPWRRDFSAFVEGVLSLGWRLGLEIDRVDPKGDYEPGNIRFVDHKTNIRSRSNTIFVEAFGVRMPLGWYIESHPLCKVNDYYVAYYRIRQGWDAEVALSKPTGSLYRPPSNTFTSKTQMVLDGERMSIADWVKSERCQSPLKDIIKRLHWGWSFQAALETPSGTTAACRVD